MLDLHNLNYVEIENKARQARAEAMRELVAYFRTGIARVFARRAAHPAA